MISIGIWLFILGCWFGLTGVGMALLERKRKRREQELVKRVVEFQPGRKAA